ncbi:hypothetical protein ISF_02961 [Cordyceps fumosorosea ARSEF 2679]|uniref:Uncharacterized protein n=1 Tax=Cordyceps fumosorosea (strain ARSEF 2679) TaxID=1081104 RepID=A0A168B6K7_CORFA|nr:hypothetical protein ISF_02961 [Cordyceps fumosorosea ARSEF 2679]OAA69691.1 hypothetical protein ISF_02961 [Cordyceps fumosorosea ARSEF 2679]
MPSLYKDAPSVPIRATAIHGRISMLVKQRYKADMPPWWDSLRELLTTLLDVGFTVSGRPSADVVWNKLREVTEASQHISVIESQINTQLSRSTQTLALDPCATHRTPDVLPRCRGWVASCLRTVCPGVQEIRA